jgi:hypothetical protein
MDIDAGRALLQALSDAGFEHVLYGSFRDWLPPGATAGSDPLAPSALPPDDIDLIVPPDDAEVSRLLRWLEQHGFGIASWNAAVHPPVAVAALAYRHYFRARRLDAQGHVIQLDVAVAESPAAFAAARTRYR